MPIAVRSFPPDIVAPITQASLIAGIRDGLIAAGFPAPLKSYTTGTDQFVIWLLNFDATKTYGRAFYRLRVSAALGVSHAVGAGFTDATNTLVNPSAEQHLQTYQNNAVIRIWGFRSDELCIVSIVQGTTIHQILGYFRFADMPSFDEGSFPKIFISTRNDAQTLSCTGLSPYGSVNLLFDTSLANSAMANPDPYLSQRSQATGILVYGPNNGGIIGRSSEDLATGACVGMSRGEVFQTPTNPVEQYILLRPAAGALLIRI